MIYNETTRHEESFEPLKQAEIIWNGLVSASPANAEYQDRLAELHIEVAIALAATGEPQMATLRYNDAAKIRERLLTEHGAELFMSKLSKCYEYYGDFLVASAQPVDALKTMMRRREVSGEYPGELMKVARQFARSSSLADDSKPFVDSALSVLRQAIEAGFSEFAELTAHADFDSIREHPEFRKLIDDASSRESFCFP